MTKTKSIYSVALTGCSFVIDKMNACQPLMDALMKHEVSENNVMMMKSQQTRYIASAKFKRRYNGSEEFPEIVLAHGQAAAAYGGVLRVPEDISHPLRSAYQLCTEKRKSANRTVTKNDASLEIYEITANDDFVDSWSEETKDRFASSFLTFMR